MINAFQQLFGCQAFSGASTILFAFSLALTGTATQTAVTVDDPATDTVTIFLYGRPEKNGARNYQSAALRGKFGYLVLYRRELYSLKELERYDILQAPQLATTELNGEHVNNWPAHHGLTVAKRSLIEWIEDRRDSNGLIKPASFSKVEIVLKTKYADRYESVTVFGTNFDRPTQLVKKNFIVLDYQAALNLYHFVRAGTAISIAISPVDDHSGNVPGRETRPGYSFFKKSITNILEERMTVSILQISATELARCKSKEVIHTS